MRKACYHTSRIKAKWQNDLTHQVSERSIHKELRYDCEINYSYTKSSHWLPLGLQWQNHVTTGQKSKQNGPTVWLVEFQVDPSTNRVSKVNLILLNLIFRYHFDEIDLGHPVCAWINLKLNKSNGWAILLWFLPCGNMVLSISSKWWQKLRFKSL